MIELEEKDAALIKKSFVKILPRRNEFSASLYERLFEVAPEARSMFSRDMTRQREKLIATLTLVVNSANKLSELREDVRELGRRHVSYGTELAHYAILRDVLVDTLAEYISDGFDDETRAAWGKLYDAITDVMTGMDTSRPPGS